MFSNGCGLLFYHFTADAERKNRRFGRKDSNPLSIHDGYAVLILYVVRSTCLVSACKNSYKRKSCRVSTS